MKNGKHNFKLRLLVLALFSPILLKAQLPETYQSKVTYLEDVETKYYVSSCHDTCLGPAELANYRSNRGQYEQVDILSDDGLVCTRRITLSEFGVRDEWMTGEGIVEVGRDFITITDTEGKVVLKEPRDNQTIEGVDNAIADPELFGVFRITINGLEELARMYEGVESYTVRLEGNSLEITGPLSFLRIDMNQQTMSEIRYNEMQIPEVQHSIEFEPVMGATEGTFYARKELTITDIPVTDHCSVKMVEEVSRKNFARELTTTEGSSEMQIEEDKTSKISALEAVQVSIDPSQNILRVQLDESSPIDVDVYDVLGHLLHSERVEESMQFSLPKGTSTQIYLVHLRSEKEERVTKVLSGVSGKSM